MTSGATTQEQKKAAQEAVSTQLAVWQGDLPQDAAAQIQQIYTKAGVALAPEEDAVTFTGSTVMVKTRDGAVAIIGAGTAPPTSPETAKNTSSPPEPVRSKKPSLDSLINAEHAEIDSQLGEQPDQREKMHAAIDALKSAVEKCNAFLNTDLTEGMAILDRANQMKGWAVGGFLTQNSTKSTLDYMVNNIHHCVASDKLVLTSEEKAMLLELSTIALHDYEIALTDAVPPSSSSPSSPAPVPSGYRGH